ncbi:Annexin D4 [Vitis vinifera]|uniref:Annexin D4 n=1 Tax=Vitis vinifera TaxID=29760 RepID=A0A438D903_VITVI|nr:Annexin D4 [Vitis vinifera]
MMEVKKATILVAFIKIRKKKPNEEGRKIMSLPNESRTLTKAFSGLVFLTFLCQDVVVQWTMHPWERDARMARKALDGRPQAYGLLIELACTRSSDELLGARKAYQSLYGESKSSWELLGGRRCFPS